jgi:hypothetical protein
MRIYWRNILSMRIKNVLEREWHFEFVGLEKKEKKEKPKPRNQINNLGYFMLLLGKIKSSLVILRV